MDTKVEFNHIITKPTTIYIYDQKSFSKDSLYVARNYSCTIWNNFIHYERIGADFTDPQDVLPLPLIKIWLTREVHRPLVNRSYVTWIQLGSADTHILGVYVNGNPDGTLTKLHIQEPEPKFIVSCLQVLH